MAEVRLSIAAFRDLELIRDMGDEQFGPTSVDRHLDRFDEIFALLANHPKAGQSRSDYGPNVRVFANNPHRILYRFDGASVLVVRVIHAARDVRRALRERQ